MGPVILDHRGRTVHLSSDQVAAEVMDSLPPEETKRLKRETMRLLWHAHGWMAPVYILVVLIIGLGTPILMGRLWSAPGVLGGWALPLTFVVVFAFAFIVFRLTSLGSDRIMRRHIPAIMLSIPVCPSCCYSLRGIESDPADGCTVCPECGAAWRVEESTRAVHSPSLRRFD